MKSERVTLLRLALAAAHPEKMKAFHAPYSEMVVFAPSVSEYDDSGKERDTDLEQIRAIDRNHKLAQLLGENGLAELEVSIDQHLALDEHVFLLDGDYSHSLGLFVEVAVTELPWLAIVRSPLYVWEAI